MTKLRPKISTLFRVALPVSLAFTLSGCSLINEAIGDSVENARVIPPGTTIDGGDFSVKVPNLPPLYPVFNQPQQGDLSLRAPESVLCGGSYNVYTFTLPNSVSPLQTLPATASSLQTAWQVQIAGHMKEKFLHNYRILSQQTNAWQDSIAWFHTGYIPNALICANCVVRRGDKYYWIVRSTPIFTEKPASNDSKEAENDLKNFLKGIKFKAKPSP